MDKAKMIKYGLTALGMVFTGIGTVIGDKVKKDDQKETIVELIKEELQNQAKES